jgi:hypothetical protein
MPDTRGACIIAATTVAQEAGADLHDTVERQFWTPTNSADARFPADPDRFRRVSMGDDGRWAGPCQQQTSGPAGARRCRCGEETAVP